MLVCKNKSLKSCYTSGSCEINNPALKDGVCCFCKVWILCGINTNITKLLVLTNRPKARTRERAEGIKPACE